MYEIAGKEIGGVGGVPTIFQCTRLENARKFFLMSSIAGFVGIRSRWAIQNPFENLQDIILPPKLFVYDGLV